MHATRPTASPVAPAPWVLRGNGFMTYWRLPAALAAVNPCSPEAVGAAPAGGLSLVIFVNYADSPVGPYGEVFIAPQQYRLRDGLRCNAISKIYVGSQSSVDNGRANWGIPKELADFAVTNDGGRSERYVASLGGRPFLDVGFRLHGPRLPLRSSWLPASMLRYVQVLDGTAYEFDLSLRGTMRWATVSDVAIDGAHFPDLAQGRLVGALQVTGFEMHMPVPVTSPAPR